MEIITDNKVVAEMVIKVMVVVTVVVAATEVVVLVVAETVKDVVGLTTTLTQNNGIVCLGKKDKLLLKHVTMQ